MFANSLQALCCNLKGLSCRVELAQAGQRAPSALLRPWGMIRAPQEVPAADQGSTAMCLIKNVGFPGMQVGMGVPEVLPGFDPPP